MAWLNTYEKWETLFNIPQIQLPCELDYAKHVYHLFVIQVKSGKEKRDELRSYLDENGIASGLHYPIPLHMQKCFEGLGYKERDFPNSKQLADCGLSLPIYPEITDDQIEFVCEKTSTFFQF